MKKLGSILLSIIMFVTICTPLVLLANTRYDEDEVSLLQEGDFGIFDYDVSTLSLNDSQLNNLKNYIYTSLKSNLSRLSVSTYRITNDEFQMVYANVINDNPDLFYVSSSYSYSYNNSNGYITIVYPEYCMSSSEIADAKIIYENGINKAISLVDDSMNDVQKALTIHDYLCNISTYPEMIVQNGQYTNDSPYFHSAYGIFYDGYTVCAGYTLTYSDIMHRLGIPSKYVISNGMHHAWNVIQIDGNWYNVDITFDELQLVKGTNNKSTMLHNCFMRSDEGIQSLTGVGHYDITYPEGVTCTDTTYDGYFWYGVNTNIYVIDGYYYYLDYDNTTRNVDLCKADISGNITKLNKNSYSTYNVTPTSSTAVGTLKYYIPFSKLIRDGDILYFSYVNGTAKIGAYDVKNNREYKEVLSHDSYNFGLDINNGVLSYSTYVDRYNYKEFNKMDFFDNSYKNYNIYLDENKDGYINAKDYNYITKR